MNYNQFWNNENIEETEEVEEFEEQTEDAQEFAAWEEEFDSDENEEYQDYSDDIDSSDCEPCSFLSEQEEIEDPDIYEESVDPETEEEMLDDSNQYSVSSLFDYDEDEQPAAQPVEQLKPEQQIDVQSEESSICFTTDYSDEEQEIEQQPVEQQQVEVQVEEVQNSEPSLPPLLNQVFTFIPSYCYFGTYLKTLSDGDIRDIEAFINKTKDAWIADKKDKMFNIPLSNITVAVLNDVDDPLVHSKRLQTLGIQMFAAEESKWNCLNLFFERDGNLKKAEIEEISKDSFEDWQWKIVQSTGFELWKSRQK